MNTKPEHKEIVKKTVFEELDTVNKLKPQQIDGLIKLEALFSPSFAFSDTQLIDNKGLRQLFHQKPTQIIKNIFEEDSLSIALGSTIEVCYRPQGKKGEEIDFRKVIENMIEKSEEPMLFSSLSPESNEKLRKLKESNGEIDYDKFISILDETEPTEARIFNNYIEWLNEIFNKKKHCSKKEWNFQNYSELVTNVIMEKEGLEKFHDKLKTPSAINFHSWLKNELEKNPDRTTLIKELQSRDEFKINKKSMRDKKIYEQILNFPYNYNLAKSHNYAFTQETRSKDITKLFYEAGLIGSKSLERTKREQIEEYRKRIERPRLLSINRRINLNGINYDHIQKIRTSEEFRVYLINGFLNNDDLVDRCKMFKKYYKFLLRELPTVNLNTDFLIISLADLPGFIYDIRTVNPEDYPFIIISHGAVLAIPLICNLLNKSKQTDRDIGRT